MTLHIVNASIVFIYVYGELHNKCRCTVVYSRVHHNNSKPSDAESKAQLSLVSPCLHLTELLLEKWDTLFGKKDHHQKIFTFCGTWENAQKETGGSIKNALSIFQKTTAIVTVHCTTCWTKGHCTTEKNAIKLTI